MITVVESACPNKEQLTKAAVKSIEDLLSQNKYVSSKSIKKLGETIIELADNLAILD